MSWEYSQGSGVLTYSGTFVWVGYSGNVLTVNDSAFESDPYQGPIPKGRYRMRLHVSSGRAPPVFKLTPEGHNAYGRTDFLIHGDNQLQNFSASEGCIILPPKIRNLILQYKNDLLEVIP